MNRGHLPAGQPVPGGGVDMGTGLGPGPGPGPGLIPSQSGAPGPRRGGGRHHHQPYAPHYHQPMYAANYGNYGAPYYPIPPQYANGPIPAASYQSHYPRSPPSMQQYVPMVAGGMGMPPAASYSRPSQNSPGIPQHSPAMPQPSPAMPLQYQPPPPLPMMPPPPPSAALPVPAPMLPHTPSSSSQSGHGLPLPMTPPTPQARDLAAAQDLSLPDHVPPPRPVIVQFPREPFRAPLPWLSRPEDPFPARTTKSRRRRRLLVSDDVEFPFTQHESVPDTVPEPVPASLPKTVSSAVPEAVRPKEPARSDGSTLEPAVVRSETPSTQDPRSEYATSTSPTTPSSVQPTQTSTAATVTPTKPASRPPVPAVPVIPALPKAGPRDTVAKENGEEKLAEDAKPEAEVVTEKADSIPPAPVKTAPKLWTGLFASSAAPATASAAAPASSSTTGNAAAADGAHPDTSNAGFVHANVKSLAEALRAFRVGSGEKLAFIEPRGLINTGNMCYMNSILQVLLFCIPFYDFLDQASKKAAHSFKSETPLVDAMIMFMREFKVIDSAASVEQLRRRLKADELEQFGEPFTPEFVYDAIRKLPRFAGMRRGHQQDAEEFLGFLLESLHEECAQIMRHITPAGLSAAPANSSVLPPRQDGNEPSEGWLEVGPKQRSAVTRSSGQSHISTPITKIFGGQLRSELRVPGLKDSVTLEPYQPLQLDIGAPHIRNIVDALKGLTKPETLHGDFNSPRGKDVTATKTVFIESLPPVLILHLKRFHFDAEGNGGTVKIWKKVGYPLDLEIPREVFSRQKRNSVLAEGAGGLPRYRLTTVVYHHGKNASGGHYTVDVRRQDGREWIRLDDTVIRRIHSDDVAEGGAEEKEGSSGSGGGGVRTPELLLGGGQRRDNHLHHDGTVTPGGGAASNRFSGINNDAGSAEEGEDEEGWKQVSGGGGGSGGSSAGATKKWSSVVNGGSSAATSSTATAPTHASSASISGTAAGPKGKQTKENVKDNKVAYLLFYQRVV